MSLRKKVVKQQSRLAALNLLGTPATSEVEDEVDSDHSSIIGDSVLPQMSEATIEDDLRHCVDELGEKRVTSRETALTNLSKLLGHYYCGFFFENNVSLQEALLQLLTRSLRKPGSLKESILAAKAISLSFVNQGDISEGDQESLYAMIVPILKNIIKDSTQVELKCQSIDTLAVITFIAGSTSSTKGGLDYFYKILISNASNINSEDEPLSANEIQSILEYTLRAYGLLYASIYGHSKLYKEEAWDEWQSSMPAHLDLLESNSKNVRVAAGENIALMYECSHTFKKKNSSDLDDENNEEEQVQDNDMTEYEELDDLIDILERLANESSRRVNKQDRKEQKSAFRDILKSIQSGEKPKEKLKLGRQKFIFRGWTQILELHVFRSLLGTGLANHFDKNELVQNIFEHGMESSDEEQAQQEEIILDSGDEESDASSIRSGKQMNRSKHSKKYKDTYY